MKSFNLNQINPRFKLGSTSSDFCDCLGLVILYLRDKGCRCNWEKDVKRQITKWEDFNNQLLINDFSVRSWDIEEESQFIVWREEDGTGHIGIVHNNFIYQMTPYGIQVSSEIPATKRPVFWYY